MVTPTAENSDSPLDILEDERTEIRTKFLQLTKPYFPQLPDTALEDKISQFEARTFAQAGSRANYLQRIAVGLQNIQAREKPQPQGKANPFSPPHLNQPTAQEVRLCLQQQIHRQASLKRQLVASQLLSAQLIQSAQYSQESGGSALNKTIDNRGRQHSSSDDGTSFALRSTGSCNFNQMPGNTPASSMSPQMFGGIAAPLEGLQPLPLPSLLPRDLFSVPANQQSALDILGLQQPSSTDHLRTSHGVADVHGGLFETHFDDGGSSITPAELIQTAHQGGMACDLSAWPSDDLDAIAVWNQAAMNPMAGLFSGGGPPMNGNDAILPKSTPDGNEHATPTAKREKGGKTQRRSSKRDSSNVPGDISGAEEEFQKTLENMKEKYAVTLRRIAPITLYGFGWQSTADKVQCRKCMKDCFQILSLETPGNLPVNEAVALLAKAERFIQTVIEMYHNFNQPGSKRHTLAVKSSKELKAREAVSETRSEVFLPKLHVLDLDQAGELGVTPSQLEDTPSSMDRLQGIVELNEEAIFPGLPVPISPETNIAAAQICGQNPILSTAAIGLTKSSQPPLSPDFLGSAIPSQDQSNGESPFEIHLSSVNVQGPGEELPLDDFLGFPLPGNDDTFLGKLTDGQTGDRPLEIQEYEMGMLTDVVGFSPVISDAWHTQPTSLFGEQSTENEILQGDDEGKQRMLMNASEDDFGKETVSRNAKDAKRTVSTDDEDSVRPTKRSKNTPPSSTTV